LNRFLSKDFLSGVMFVAFGLIALYFGRNLALGTTVRMGPGYVPHMLANIMMLLGCGISLIALVGSAAPRERETVWIPVSVVALAFIVIVRFLLLQLFTSPPPLFVQMASDWVFLISVAGVLAVFLGVILVCALGGMRAHEDGLVDVVEAPKWRPITMVTIGIVAFALLLEPPSSTWLSTWLPTWLAIWLPPTGMFPALVALVFIASLGGDEFKLWEVAVNTAVLTVLCVLVFKVGLSMNIAILNGVW